MQNKWMKLCDLCGVRAVNQPYPELTQNKKDAFITFLVDYGFIIHSTHGEYKWCASTSFKHRVEGFGDDFEEASIDMLFNLYKFLSNDERSKFLKAMKA